MGQLLAFDLGTVRTGIAESDPMRIIASPVGYVKTAELLQWLDVYLTTHSVDALVVGEPKRMHGEASDVESFIQKTIQRIQTAHPNLSIERQDERFTSVMAQQAMLDGGLKKGKRREKGVVDQISAVLILQAWMERNPA